MEMETDEYIKYMMNEGLASNTVIEICAQMGINRAQFYRILDKYNMEQIQKFRDQDMTETEICERLKIKEEKYFTLLKKYSSAGKTNKKTIKRDHPKYIRIDNYNELELYRGIIVEAISRICDSEELIQTKEMSPLKVIRKDISPSSYIQNMKDAISHDKKKIKEAIKKVSVASEETIDKDRIIKLKNNDWAIRVVYRIINYEKNLIVSILKELSIGGNSPFVIINHHNKQRIYTKVVKEYIDILNEEIERKYQYRSKRKKTKGMFDNGRSIQLVKYYLLKYIQKPLIIYCNDYSNSLLDEYNFQKINLTIDLMIPIKEQQKLIAKTIENLYHMELPYDYTKFIKSTLFDKEKDIKYHVVQKGRKAERHDSLSERIADLFYIYDLRKNHFSYEMCTEFLSEYYENKNGSTIAQSSVHALSKKISSFMDNFQKTYKL